MLLASAPATAWPLHENLNACKSISIHTKPSRARDKVPQNFSLRVLCPVLGTPLREAFYFVFKLARISFNPAKIASLPSLRSMAAKNCSSHARCSARVSFVLMRCHVPSNGKISEQKFRRRLQAKLLLHHFMLYTILARVLNSVKFVGGARGYEL